MNCPRKGSGYLEKITDKIAKKQPHYHDNEGEAQKLYAKCKGCKDPELVEEISELFKMEEQSKLIDKEKTMFLLKYIKAGSTVLSDRENATDNYHSILDRVDVQKLPRKFMAKSRIITLVVS